MGASEKKKEDEKEDDEHKKGTGGSWQHQHGGRLRKSVRVE